MMRWEARWHEDDEDGTSERPEETDFYFYDSLNRLEKAVYNATQYGSDTTIELSHLPLASDSFGSDVLNEGTYSDRVYYARRKAGTRSDYRREAVPHVGTLAAQVWYRGTATRTDPGISQNDTTTGPTQTTNYATSDGA